MELSNLSGGLNVSEVNLWIPRVGNNSSQVVVENIMQVLLEEDVYQTIRADGIAVLRRNLNDDLEVLAVVRQEVLEALQALAFAELPEEVDDPLGVEALGLSEAAANICKVVDIGVLVLSLEVAFDRSLE